MNSGENMDAKAQTSKGDCETSSGLTDDTQQGNVAQQTNVDSEREETGLIKGEHSDLKKDNVCRDSKKSPVGPVESEDTNMDEPSDDGQDTTDMEVQESTNVSLPQKNPTCAGNFLVSSADDLDEMMDIGTVDQVDQEAQMKEQSKSLEGVNSQTLAVSNAGKVKQSCLFIFQEMFILTFFSIAQGSDFCNDLFNL